MEDGRPPPAWFLDCPEMLPGDMIYLRAFWDLRTEAVSGMTVGRIPWSKARQYGREELELPDDMLPGFWRIIAKLDDAFAEWNKAEYDKTKSIREARDRGPGAASETLGRRTVTRRSFPNRRAR